MFTFTRELGAWDLGDGHVAQAVRRVAPGHAARRPLAPQPLGQPAHVAVAAQRVALQVAVEQTGLDGGGSSERRQCSMFYVNTLYVTYISVSAGSWLNAPGEMHVTLLLASDLRKGYTSYYHKTIKSHIYTYMQQRQRQYLQGSQLRDAVEHPAVDL